MSAEWEHAFATTVDRCYRTIDNDPQILLEQDGGPYGIVGDIYHARLIGFEDEIVTDMTIPAIVSELYIPIPLSPSKWLAESSPDEYWPTFRRATYVLQSGYAIAHISTYFCPPASVTHDENFNVRIVALRYRRRS